MLTALPTGSPYGALRRYTPSIRTTSATTEASSEISARSATAAASDTNNNPFDADNRLAGEEAYLAEKKAIAEAEAKYALEHDIKPGTPLTAEQRDAALKELDKSRAEAAAARGDATSSVPMTPREIAQMNGVLRARSEAGADTSADDEASAAGANGNQAAPNSGADGRAESSEERDSRKAAEILKNFKPQTRLQWAKQALARAGAGGSEEDLDAAAANLVKQMEKDGATFPSNVLTAQQEKNREDEGLQAIRNSGILESSSPSAQSVSSTAASQDSEARTSSLSAGDTSNDKAPLSTTSNGLAQVVRPEGWHPAQRSEGEVARAPAQSPKPQALHS